MGVRLVDLEYRGGESIKAIEVERIAGYFDGRETGGTPGQRHLVDAEKGRIYDLIARESPLIVLSKTPVLADFEAGTLSQELIERIIPTKGLKEAVFREEDD